MNPLIEYIYNLTPIDKKIKANGEVCFNGVCCYRTERPDTKHRAGMKFTDDSFIYNCFNCKFSCGFTVGNYMSKKCYQLLKDMGATAQDIMNIHKMVEEYATDDVKTNIVQTKRVYRDIPPEYKSINQSLYDGDKSETLKAIKQYIDQRNMRLYNWADLMWAEGKPSFLIPCYEYGKIVGYSLRLINDESEHKYIHYIPSGYIYNFDILQNDRKYEIVVEGQLDALALNCLSILSNVFTEDKLKRLLQASDGKKIILLPDRDKAGKKMVEQLLENNYPFSVSFPNWDNGIKDAEDAVKKYGRLYALYKILDSVIDDKLKIKMEMIKWFPKE